MVDQSLYATPETLIRYRAMLLVVMRQYDDVTRGREKKNFQNIVCMYSRRHIPLPGLKSSISAALDQTSYKLGLSIAWYGNTVPYGFLPAAHPRAQELVTLKTRDDPCLKAADARLTRQHREMLEELRDL